MSTIARHDLAPILLQLPGAPGEAQLVVRAGWASAGAPGKPNEDFVGLVCPAEPELSARGAVFALADGVSANGAGRPAAETAARSLLADYYATPAEWSVAVALDRVLRAVSDWLVAENTRRPSVEGVVAAVSGLVLMQHRYFLAHVGDTRVYRLRGPALEQLTTDHTWPRRDMRHVLKRAIGLDTHLVVDFASGEVLAGDTFLMASDGVWDVLGDAELERALAGEPDAQRAASALVEQARAHQAGYMGRNDASAVVLRVSSSA